MKRFFIAPMVAFWIVLFLISGSWADGVTPSQKAKGEEVRATLVTLGEREVVGNGVWYSWHSNWYALDFQSQHGLMRSIADAEYCASEGRLTHMHILYRNEEVANATPRGGIQVLKSRP